MNPKVAISQRVDHWEERGERRDALDQRLSQWLWAMECLPLPIPNSLASLDGAHANGSVLHVWLRAVAPDALLLSGGNDIGSVQERDLTEAQLLGYARDRALPVLGICRGMQEMAVWSGGRLAPVIGHVRTCHRLRVVEGGAWPDTVNSFHTLALDGCPSEYRVAARSEDGVIESIRHTQLPWEGWMWHPERVQSFNTQEMMRFRTLLEAGRGG